MSRILLLEDDLSLVTGLSFALKKQGFALNTARTLREADAAWADGSYDLLVLDVSLPDGSGFAFCEKVRRTSNVPIMFLTASDEETNIIMGLDMGGDDYITKPFKLGGSCFPASTPCCAGRMPSAPRTRSCSRTASGCCFCRGRPLKTANCWR